MTDGITMEQCDTICGHAHCVMCVHLVCMDDLQSEEWAWWFRTLEACVVKCAGQSHCI